MPSCHIMSNYQFFSSHQCTNHLEHSPVLPSPIVTHPALGKAKHRKVIVVQHLGHRPLRMVFGDECLHISSEVVYDHQHVLHYGLPVSRYGNFHSDVVDMD